jgi:uncharacterized protein
VKGLLRSVAGLITVIGAINWGLVGLFNFDIVQSLFGTMPMLKNAVYVFIGLCGVASLFFEAGEHKYM